MGVYWYCGDCGHGLERPTGRQIVEEAARCPHCDHLNVPRDTLADHLDRIEERLTELEEENYRLKKGLD